MNNFRQAKVLREGIIRKHRKFCKGCHKRPAIFLSTVRKKKGRIEKLGKRVIVKADKTHDLCLQCRRSLGDSFYVHQFFSGGK